MIFSNKFRLPYRGDSLFGCLFLLALLLPLAFDVYNFESFEIIKFGLLLLLAGAGLWVFFKRRAAGQASLRLTRPMVLALLAFLFWALLATVFAVDKNYAFFGFYPRFTSGFIFYFLWVALFFLVAAQTLEQLWVLIRLLFVCSGLVALWGLLQSVGFGFYIGPASGLFTRAAPSFLGNPDFSSMFVAACLPLGPYLWQAAKSLKAKAYLGISIFLQIWAVVIFASRGALLALCAGLVCGLLLSLAFYKKFSWRPARVYAACLALFFLLAGGFLNFARPGVATTSFSLSETNVSQRLDVWSLAVKSFQGKPLLGYGLGSFELVFENHRQLSGLKNGFFDDPHNLFLYLAVSGGAVFLLLFLFLAGYPAILSLVSLNSLANDDAAKKIALISAIAAWMLAAFFNPVVIACYVLLVFLISGLFTQARPYSAGLPLRRAGQTVAAILIIYGVCFIAAEHLFFGSIRSYNANKFRAARSLARAAVALNPFNNLYYEYLAGSTIRAGLPDSAAAPVLKKFQNFHPLRAYTYAELANLYYLQLYQSQSLAVKPLIIQNLEKAISLDPTAANNYFLLSQYQLVFGDLKAAESRAQQGLALDPKNFEALMFLAKIYQYAGNRQLLVQTLERAAPYNNQPLSLDQLISLAKNSPDLSKLPLNIILNVGRLD